MNIFLFLQVGTRLQVGGRWRLRILLSKWYSNTFLLKHCFLIRLSGNCRLSYDSPNHRPIREIKKEAPSGISVGHIYSYIIMVYHMQLQWIVHDNGSNKGHIWRSCNIFGKQIWQRFWYGHHCDLPIHSNEWALIKIYTYIRVYTLLWHYLCHVLTHMLCLHILKMMEYLNVHVMYVHKTYFVLLYWHISIWPRNMKFDGPPEWISN